jgi:uncharacterized repeat protein (TIGR01451 family)
MTRWTIASALSPAISEVLVRARLFTGAARRHSVPVTRLLWALLAALLLVPVGAGSAAAAGSAEGVVQQAAAPEHRRTSRLQLDLVSRDYDNVSGSWTVVVESRLDSNRICVPAVFDCIVEPGADPAGATLTDVECLDSWWGHLGIFTDSCLKQLFWAGHDQRFRYTYVTDPGVAPSELAISSRFGRGLFPIMLQELASDDLVVSLTEELDVAGSCPSSVVQAGAAFTCEVTLTYPDDHPAGVPVTVANLDGVLTGDTGVTLNAITTSSPEWDCSTIPCTLDAGQQIDPGDSATFTIDATADPSVVGGTLTNTVTVDYGTPSKQAVTSGQLVVVGSGDTDLSITKVADQASAAPGQQVSWTITVTNAGVPGSVALPADGVTVADLAPGAVTGLAVRHLSGGGTWSCDGAVCSNPSMPPGTATFQVTGTLAADATAGVLVNEVDVTWSNDVLGPDFPVVAAGTIEVQVPVPSTTTTTAAPTPTTTTAPAAAPARLAFVG